MALESSPEQPQPLRVVAHAVKGWIERLGWVWTEGQLIEINRRSGSRTVFLTLRDKLAEVSASVAISPTNLDLAGPLQEGSTVAVRIKPSYYTPSGRFSFYCDEIRPVGEGRLLARLEQTKRLLQAEGLFDRVRKQPLPFLPKAVGLITGGNSAAERDVIENARRRWPAVVIEIRNTLVQGPQAAEEMITALRNLDKLSEVEVIILARGGGSLEDLLPFSDEGLIRAVAACRTPVISAIGHETDQPILDLVADVRASTPTDAAKLVVPDVAQETHGVGQARLRMRQAVAGLVGREQAGLDALRSRPVLGDPRVLVDARREELDALLDRSRRCVRHALDRAHDDIGHQRARARALSPLATLQRGYSVVQDADGHVVTSVAGVSVGAPVSVRVADGRIHAAVSSTERLDQPTQEDGDE